MYFPREVWAGSPHMNARQPKRFVVHDEKEFLDYIKIYNGKMNVYTSVYNYDEFSDNRGLEHSVIIDRIFLDIDLPLLGFGIDSIQYAQFYQIGMHIRLRRKKKGWQEFLPARL